MNVKSWCCTASIHHEISKVHLQRISGYNGICNSDVISNVSSSIQKEFQKKISQLDITKAPDWMEYIEITEQRFDNDGGAGAYDSMRGDLQLSNKASTKHNHKWFIWGQDFHIQRLQKSYLSLLQSSNKNITSCDDALLASIDDKLEVARVESKRILESLLYEAEDVMKYSTAEVDQGDQHDEVKLINMVRLTLLWSQGSVENNLQGIVVRGHACSTMCPINVYGPVQPIECAIAAEIHHTFNDDIHTGFETTGNMTQSMIPTVQNSIPSRYQNNPQSKVAAWTRIRKTLEDPERYKPSGVSEVLMVRAMTNEDSRTTEIVLLEGLSSNVFIVYKDGTLRTAVNGVLHGYVRQLVLDCASTMDGLRIDLKQPIRLEDVNEWHEAFITSSTRLLYPISKIIIQHHLSNGETEFRDFWCDPVMAISNGSNHNVPIWQKIYDSIMHQAGY
jgi:hypothetical protein